jgi:TPR repeat protein
MGRAFKALMLAAAILVTSMTASLTQDLNKGLAAAQSGDYATALREWRPLAEQGNAGAQYNVGVMYDNGQGVPQNYKAAIKWYRMSAEQGNMFAQYNLGNKYYHGKGITQDYKEAVSWYRKAAEQGNVGAQNNLGVMYGRGEGVLQDFVIAHMWWNIAASNGHADAVKARDLVAKQMTAADISKAQELARECVQKNYKGC